MTFFFSRRRLEDLLVPVVTTMRRRQVLPGIPRGFMRETPPPPQPTILDGILKVAGGISSVVTLYGAITIEKEKENAGDGRSRDAALQSVTEMRKTKEATKGDGEMTNEATKEGDGGNIDLLFVISFLIFLTNQKK